MREFQDEFINDLDANNRFDYINKTGGLFQANVYFGKQILDEVAYTITLYKCHRIFSLKN